MSLQKEFFQLPHFFNSITCPMHSFTGSPFIQYKVPVFIIEASRSLSTFYLSASSKSAPPATRDASLGSAHELLSNKQLRVFCWPNPPC